MSVEVEAVRSRIMTAYGLIESLVDALDAGGLRESLAAADSVGDVAATEGARALRAIDAFAQQLGVDVEEAQSTHKADTQSSGI
jgi:hypothetical protein